MSLRDYIVDLRENKDIFFLGGAVLLGTFIFGQATLNYVENRYELYRDIMQMKFENVLSEELEDRRREGVENLPYVVPKTFERKHIV